MEPLPPEVYVPIAAALAGAIVALAGAIRVLWRRDIKLSDQLINYQRTAAADATRAMYVNSEALNANTEALEAIRDVVDRAADGRASGDNGGRGRNRRAPNRPPDV